MQAELEVTRHDVRVLEQKKGTKILKRPATSVASAIFTLATAIAGLLTGLAHQRDHTCVLDPSS